MKSTGIWLDKHKALIVTIENGAETFTEIVSSLKGINTHAGPGNHLNGGIQSSTYLNYEKETLKKYFREIATTIADADSIVIYGPAETNLKLEKELKENYKDIAKKVLKVEKADSMTTNQVKALIRDFYNN